MSPSASSVPDLARRANTPELLDGDDLPAADLHLNLRELEFINKWLGGHAITIKGIRKLAGDAKKLHICEAGCGGGDNLNAIAAWCRKRDIEVTLTGIDIKPSAIEYAGKNTGGRFRLICQDIRQVRFDEKPDIIFSSLFCHHFTDEQLAGILQWKQENSRMGFFINDLHRHPLAYHSIKWLTRMFSSSYLVKNDAPLSVRRGFTREEWETLFDRARITAEINWEWAFRWLIIAKK
jgi:SAM-dependent methyltransferase